MEKDSRDFGVPVQLIQLSKFINDEVANRELPRDIDSNIHGKPRVVMKMDIEGSEVEVIQDLIMKGVGFFLISLN